MSEKREISERDRERLNAMQGVYEDDRKGIFCIKCGCADIKVVTTMEYDGGIRRYRQCRNCGKRFRTHEIVS